MLQSHLTRLLVSTAHHSYSHLVSNSNDAPVTPHQTLGLCCSSLIFTPRSFSTSLNPQWHLLHSRLEEFSEEDQPKLSHMPEDLCQTAGIADGPSASLNYASPSIRQDWSRLCWPLSNKLRSHPMSGPHNDLHLPLCLPDHQSSPSRTMHWALHARVHGCFGEVYSTTRHTCPYLLRQSVKLYWCTPGNPQTPTTSWCQGDQDSYLMLLHDHVHKMALHSTSST